MKRLILAAIAILGMGVTAQADYDATPGAGLTFGSGFVSSVHYSKMMLCDLGTPATQCAAVDSSGRVSVTGAGGTFPATQSGTWTVQPGNTANTTPWLMTISQGGTNATVASLGADGVSNSTTGLNVYAKGQLYNGTTWDRARGDVTGGAWVQGAVASGSTDSGNPVKVGGVYNSTPPTLTNGQRGDVQLTANGEVKVSGTGVGAGSTTSGQTMSPLGCAVLTSAPTYTTAQTNFINCNTSGEVRTVLSSLPALAAGTNNIGDVDVASIAAGTNRVGYVTDDPCTNKTKLNVPISQTTSTQIITGTGGQNTYICSVAIIVGGAEAISIVAGTGTVCATSIAAVLGATTAANGISLPANGGLTLGNGGASVAVANDATGDNVCILQDGTDRVSGVITYVQQ